MNTRRLLALAAIAGVSLFAIPRAAQASWSGGSAFSFSLSIGDGICSSSAVSFGLFSGPTYTPSYCAEPFFVSSCYSAYDPCWGYARDPVFVYQPYLIQPVRRIVYHPYFPSYSYPSSCYYPGSFGYGNSFGISYSNYGFGSFFSFSLSFGDSHGPRYWRGFSRDDCGPGWGGWNRGYGWRDGRSFGERDRRGNDFDGRDGRDGRFGRDGRDFDRRDRDFANGPSNGGVVGPVPRTGPTQSDTRTFGDSGVNRRRPDAPPREGRPSAGRPLASKPIDVAPERPQWGNRPEPTSTGTKPVGNMPTPTTGKPATQPKPDAPVFGGKPTVEPNKNVVVGPVKGPSKQAAPTPSKGRAIEVPSNAGRPSKSAPAARPVPSTPPATKAPSFRPTETSRPTSIPAAKTAPTPSNGKSEVKTPSRTETRPSAQPSVSKPSVAPTRTEKPTPRAQPAPKAAKPAASRPSQGIQPKGKPAGSTSGKRGK